MTDRDNYVGVDILYAPGESVFGLAGPMMLSHGWSVFPQERSGGRYPSKINGKSFAWGPLQDRLPTAVEMADFCNDARTANVAATMGEASGRAFALDIDCMNAQVRDRIYNIAFEMLGRTPFVRVGRAPKTALFYRYMDQSPRNTVLRFTDHLDCMLEVQGHGKLMTMYGLHHVTGRYFHWPDLNPLSSPVSEAPEVTVQQLESFLHTVRTQFKVAAPTLASSTVRNSDFNAEVDAEGLVVPTVEVDEKLQDGREAYLRDVCWGLVWRNQSVIGAAQEAGDLDAMSVRLTDLAQKCFIGICRMDGRWTGHYLRTQAGSKIAGAIRKLLDGKMKPCVPIMPKKEPEVRSAAAAAQVARMAADAGRPIIRVVPGAMTDTVNAAEAALTQVEAGLYQRGGALVSVIDEQVPSSSGMQTSRRIKVREEHSLAELMGRHAVWLRHDARKGAEVVVDPPMSVVQAFMARAEWKLPVLSGVMSCPTMRADGSLLVQPGHDAATGILYEDGGEAWDILREPTRADAEAAMAKLKALVSTFPFVSEEDRAVAISCMLTACVRRSLPAVPLHAFSAPAAGTGKSKLADIAAVFCTGKKAAVVNVGPCEAEFEKRLVSSLLAGYPVIALDNISETNGDGLGGDFVCQTVTQESVRVRVLGKSEAPEVPTGSLMTATGNNLRVAADMTRRTLLCRMDAGVERPEFRVFSNDPVEQAMEHRAEYVSAALTVLRAYVVAGRPNRQQPLGSFERWCFMVRDAMTWLGCADPVLTVEAARSSDTKLENTRTAFLQWFEAFGERRVSVKAIIERASQRTVGEQEFKNADLREALIVIAGDGGAVSSRRLGKLLSSLDSRIIGGLRLSRDGEVGGVTMWTLKKV